MRLSSIKLAPNDHPSKPLFGLIAELLFAEILTRPRAAYSVSSLPFFFFYWPYLFLLSDGFARLELDYVALAYAFVSFGDSAPSSEEIAGYTEEYEKAHLIFCYGPQGKSWGQWDSRRSFLKAFKTASDMKSPHPPEPEYLRWLQEQHGNDWPAYHWNKEISIAAARSQSGTVQDLASNQDATTKSSQTSGKTSVTGGQDSPEFRRKVRQGFALGVGLESAVGTELVQGMAGGKGSRRRKFVRMKRIKHPGTCRPCLSRCTSSTCCACRTPPNFSMPSPKLSERKRRRRYHACRCPRLQFAQGCAGQKRRKQEALPFLVLRPRLRPQIKA